MLLSNQPRVIDRGIIWKYCGIITFYSYGQDVGIYMIFPPDPENSDEEEKNDTHQYENISFGFDLRLKNRDDVLDDCVICYNEVCERIGWQWAKIQITHDLTSKIVQLATQLST